MLTLLMDAGYHLTGKLSSLFGLQMQVDDVIASGIFARNSPHVE